MEEDTTRSSHSSEKEPALESQPSVVEEKMSTEKTEFNATAFVNHAATAWHENRRKWVGDQPKHSKYSSKDPIISWSTTYEELLSTNEPFSEPIPLQEMVDFLVDIWHDEGLELCDIQLPVPGPLTGDLQINSSHNLGKFSLV